VQWQNFFKKKELPLWGLEKHHCYFIDLDKAWNDKYDDIKNLKSKIFNPYHADWDKSKNGN